MMHKEITTRQRQILQYIVQHIDMRGYPPTVREIGEAVNLSSSSTVHAHLRTLEDAGLIKRDAVLTRAIKPLPSMQTKPTTQKTISLPVLGRIAAGRPLLAVEDAEEMFPLPNDFLSGGEGFMLRVKGESMIDDGIKEGDLVVVRKQQNADNGDVVVAMLDNEATVKHFYRENGRVRLQPANSAMDPIYADNVQIIGKVVGLVRRM